MEHCVANEEKDMRSGHPARRGTSWVGGLRTAMLLALTAPCVALAADSGFEGVPWGASEAQLRQALGEGVGTRTCPQGKEEPDLRRYAKQCGPYFENYLIDGISFMAFFGIRTAEGPLQAIYLDRVATVTNEQIKAGQGSEYRYNRVKKVLTERHGAPVRVSETTERPRDRPAVLKVEWTTADSTITLTESIVSEARGQMYHLGLEYTPRADSAQNP